jgi:hypothetical protein
MHHPTWTIEPAVQHSKLNIKGMNRLLSLKQLAEMLFEGIWKVVRIQLNMNAIKRNKHLTGFRLSFQYGMLGEIKLEIVSWIW